MRRPLRAFGKVAFRSSPTAPFRARSERPRTARATAGVPNPFLRREVRQAIDLDTIPDTAERLPALQGAVRQVEKGISWVPLLYNSVAFVVDRTLRFEPREELLPRYAAIGTQGR